MDARTRLGRIRLYEEIGNAGVVCRRCGIARPTLRKWWRRYQVEGWPALRRTATSRATDPAARSSPKRKS